MTINRQSLIIRLILTLALSLGIAVAMTEPAFADTVHQVYPDGTVEGCPKAFDILLGPTSLNDTGEIAGCGKTKGPPTFDQAAYDANAALYKAGKPLPVHAATGPVDANGQPVHQVYPDGTVEGCPKAFDILLGPSSLNATGEIAGCGKTKGPSTFDQAAYDANAALYKAGKPLPVHNPTGSGNMNPNVNPAPDTSDPNYTLDPLPSGGGGTTGTGQFNTTNIVKLSNWLEWLALLACVIGICISSALWAIGSKGQNPGQELTGKKGLILCCTAAFFIGALPGMLEWLEGAASQADNTGVVGSGPTGGAPQGNPNGNNDGTGPNQPGAGADDGDVAASNPDGSTGCGTAGLKNPIACKPPAP